MEYDIYDSLRLTATTCEKIADVLNAIAECFEKVTACLTDLIEEIKRQPLKIILQKLRPDYKDKCKIRWLDTRTSRTVCSLSCTIDCIRCVPSFSKRGTLTQRL